MLGSFAVVVEIECTKGQEVNRSEDKGSAIDSYFSKGQSSVGEGMSSSWV